MFPSREARFESVLADPFRTATSACVNITGVLLARPQTKLRGRSGCLISIIGTIGRLLHRVFLFWLHNLA